MPLAVTFPLSGRFRDLHPLEYVRAGRTIRDRPVEGPVFAFLAVRDSSVPGDDVHHESPVSTPEGAVTFPEPEVCDSFFEQIIHVVEAEGPPERFIRGDILRAYPV